MEERVILSALFKGNTTNSCFHQMMNKSSIPTLFFWNISFFVFFVFKALKGIK